MHPIDRDKSREYLTIAYNYATYFREKRSKKKKNANGANYKPSFLTIASHLV